MKLSTESQCITVTTVGNCTGTARVGPSKMKRAGNLRSCLNTTPTAMYFTLTLTKTGLTQMNMDSSERTTTSLFVALTQLSQHTTPPMRQRPLRLRGHLRQRHQLRHRVLHPSDLRGTRPQMSRRIYRQ